MTIYSHGAPDDHRSVHTFPTRRSSDLSRSRDRPPRHCPKVHWPKRRGAPRHRSQCATPANGLSDNVDRKSTRLNSSHVKISYAVFCLKKKKYFYMLLINPCALSSTFDS